MNWLLNRLKEKSTWLGIFTMLGLFGMKIKPEFQELIIQAILAVAAVVAFIFRENIRERAEDQFPRETSLPPIELVGRPEAFAESDDSKSFVSGTDPARNRRVTDQWVRDPVPSESRFKHSVHSNKGVVGWNDQH